jgi:hypothetical protein
LGLAIDGWTMLGGTLFWGRAMLLRRFAFHCLRLGFLYSRDSLLTLLHFILALWWFWNIS